MKGRSDPLWQSPGYQMSAKFETVPACPDPRATGGPRTFGGKTPDRGALQITDLQPLGDWAVGLLDDPGHFQAYLRSKTGKRRYRDIKETSLSGVFPS